MFTVRDLTERVRQHEAGFYPDDALDNNSRSLVLQVVNEAHSKIARRCELFNEETIVVNLVAGQREYDYPTDVFRTNAVIYHENPNSRRVLRETSVDELDKAYRAWRTVAPSVPTRWYLQGSKVGFVQTPNLNTLGGYPYVAFEAIRPGTFTSLDDPLPAVLPDLDAYVYGVLWRWSVMQAPQQAAGYAGLAQASMNDLKSHLYGRTTRKSVRVLPSVPRVG